MRAKATTSWLQVPGIYDAFSTNRSALLEWPLDDQIVWHHAAVQSQMEQLYYGLAIAAALNRTIILPQVGQRSSPPPWVTAEQLSRW